MKKVTFHKLTGKRIGYYEGKIGRYLVQRHANNTYDFYRRSLFATQLNPIKYRVIWSLI